MKKELLGNALDDAFTNLFDEAKKSKENVFVAVYVTDGTDTDGTNKARMSMHGEPNDVLAAICVAIHRYAEETHQSVTEVLLRIAHAMSEEE